jgi:hypothetical protein
VVHVVPRSAKEGSRRPRVRAVGERLMSVREAAQALGVCAAIVYRLVDSGELGIRDTFELVGELRCHGVEIVSVADGFDLNGPAAEIVLAVMNWPSKMERIAIGEARVSSRGSDGSAVTWIDYRA